MGYFKYYYLFLVCSAGHEPSGSGCHPCAHGFFKSTEADVSCTPCTSGKNTTNTGSTSSSNCSKFVELCGQIQQNCLVFDVTITLCQISG